MRTIEERANTYIGHPFEVDEGSTITMARHSYVQGATEQKAIDIDKACEWLKDNCRGLVSYNNANGGETYPFIEAFIKAMEE